MNAHKHLTRNQQGARAVAAGELTEDGGEGGANWRAAFCGNHYKRRSSETYDRSLLHYTFLSISLALHTSLSSSALPGRDMDIHFA